MSIQPYTFQAAAISSNASFAHLLPNLPLPTLYIEGVRHHCEQFRNDFPSRVDLLNDNQVGLFKAGWKAASYLFTGVPKLFSGTLKPTIPYEEQFESAFHEVESTKESILTDLNLLEHGDLSFYHDLSETDFQEIKSIRADPFLLGKQCLPVKEQGLEAVKNWKGQLDALKSRSDLLLKKIKARNQIQTQYDSSCSTLHKLIDTEPEVPVKENFIAAINADIVDSSPDIEIPDTLRFLQQLRSKFQNLEDPWSKDAVKGIEAAELFEGTVFKPFRDTILQFPVRRFVQNEYEFNDILSKAVDRFHTTLASHLDDPSQKSIFIPGWVFDLNQDKLKDLMKNNANGFDPMQLMNKLVTGRHYILEIKRAEEKFSVTAHFSPPEQTIGTDQSISASSIEWADVERDQLLNRQFLEQLLRQTTFLRPVAPLKELSWPLSFAHIYHDTTKSFHKIANNIKERLEEFANGLQAYAPDLNAKNQGLASLITDHLGKNPRVTPENRSHLKSASGSMWDSWKALFANAEKEELVLDFKLASLVQWSEKESKEVTPSEAHLNLLKIVHAHLNGLSARFYEEKLISAPKFEFVVKTLEKVQRQIVEKEKKWRQFLIETERPFVSTVPVFSDSFQDLVKMPDKAPVSTQVAKKISNFSLIPVPQTQGSIAEIQSFADRLKEQYSQENYNGIIHAVKAFFDQFNMAALPESFWNRLTPQGASNLLISLAEIDRFYFKSYFDADVSHLPDAESGLLMIESMALSDRLIPKLPSDHALSTHYMPLIHFAPYLQNRTPFFQSADPKLDSRLLALRVYYENSLISHRDPIKLTKPIFQEYISLIPRTKIMSTEVFLNEMKSPSISASGGNRLTYQNEEHFWMRNERALGYYLNHFISKFDEKYTKNEYPQYAELLKIEKAIKMYTGECKEVLPETFYALQRIAFFSGYFFRGTFAKPPQFVKKADSYDFKFTVSDVFETMFPIDMHAHLARLSAKAIEKITGEKHRMYQIHTELNGIDESVFQNNPDLADGHVKGHQFSHLQRPAVDPVVKPLFDQHLISSSSNPYPGVSDFPRTSSDINMVSIQDIDSLKQYLDEKQLVKLYTLTGEPSVQVANTLSFFREFPVLLDIPDMRLAFNSLLFAPPLLYDDLIKPQRGPELARQLADFIGTHYSIASYQKNFSLMGFYLDLAVRLRHYIHQAKKEHPECGISEVPPIFENVDLLLTQVKQDFESNDVHKGVWNGIAALHEADRDALDAAQVKQFLKHVLAYQRFPASGKESNILLQEDLKRRMKKLAPLIVDTLQKADSKFFSELVEGIYDKNVDQLRFSADKNNSLIYASDDQSITIDFQEGKLIAQGLYGIAIPSDALASEAYRSLYGSQEFRCRAITQSTFEFIDRQQKINRLVRKENGDYILLRKLDANSDHWHQFVPKSKICEEKKKIDGAQISDQLKDLNEAMEKILPNLKGQSKIVPAQALIDHHFHWYSPELNEVLILNGANKMLYRISLFGSDLLNSIEFMHMIEGIYKLDDQGKNQFKLVNIYKDNPPFAWLRNFEDPSYVLVWKDLISDEPQRIEFVRFGKEGLSFKKNGKQFESDQYPGYFLKSLQINPLGAQSPNFLSLQNSQGDEKLLLAMQKNSAAFQGALTNRLSFQRDTKAGNRQELAAYDRAKNDKLFSNPDREASFYLAFNYALNKRYGEAITLLRDFSSSSRFLTIKELMILKWIQGLNAEGSSELTAVRMLAEIIKKKDQLDRELGETKKKDQSSEKDALMSLLNDPKKDASNYFEVCSQLGILRLNFQEELFLLTHYYGLPDEMRNIIEKRATQDASKARELIDTAFRIAQSSKDFSQIKDMPLQVVERAAAKGVQADFAMPPLFTDLTDLVEMTQSTQGSSVISNINQKNVTDLCDGQGTSEVETNAFEFYKKDTFDYMNSLDSHHYKLKDLSAFIKKREETQLAHQYWKEVLLTLEYKIVHHAAKPSEDPIERAKQQALKEGKCAASPDLGDLIHAYMHRNTDLYLQSNPHLTQKDIEKIESLIDIYLDLSVNNAARKSVIEKMEAVESLANVSEEHPAKRLALRNFVEQTKIQRQFIPDKTNRFLKVFEYFNGFYYRKKQIENLKHLGVKIDTGELAGERLDGLILEMMVGSGKTTALLPTTGFWNADGKRLSLAVMPQSLIENMAVDVERILGKTFAQKVRRLEFSISTDLGENNLNSILKFLNDVIEKKEYLIMTDKNLKAMVNQFARLLLRAKQTRNSAAEQSAEAMLKILKVFHKLADVVIDEGDLILSPRIELNYPEGQQWPIPEPYINLTVKLYQILTSPKIRDLIHFEFLPTSSSTAPYYTSKQFEKIKPQLVDLFFNELNSDKDDDETIQTLKRFYKNCSTTQQQQLKNYLLNQDDKERTAETWLKDKQGVRDLFGLLKGQLHVLLPLTLSKNYGERYGFHAEESVVADPFSASNSPNKGAQFSDPFERINFSIQAHYKVGGRKIVIEKLLLNLRQKVMQEVQENLEKIKKLPPGQVYKTEAEKEFESYFGPQFKLFGDEKIIEKLQNYLETNREATFNLLKKYILPQIKLFDQNLKATSQSFSYLFDHRIKGFTGTLSNGETFNDQIRKTHESGSRGQIIALSLSQAQDKVHEIGTRDSSAVHQKLLNDPKFPHIRSIIDSGGGLKKTGLDDVARDWLQKFSQEDSKIRGVVFLNDAGRKMILEKGAAEPIALEKSQIPIEERASIYGQKHTIGVDLKQPIDTVALLTVSKSMVMSNFIQAFGRLRQRDAGQRIEIVVLEEDAVVIKEMLQKNNSDPLSIQDILRFLIKNEVKKQVEDNEVATTHKIKAVLPEWLLKKLIKADGVTKIEIDPKLIEKLFFQTPVISPFETYGQTTELVDAKTAFDQEIERVLSPELVQLIDNSEIDQLKAQMKKTIKIGTLAPQIRRAAIGADVEEEQEIEQEQEQQQEQQQQQVQEKAKLTTPFSHKMWGLSETILNDQFYENLKLQGKLFNANKLLLHDNRFSSHINNKRLDSLEKLFDEDFLISKNLCPIDSYAFSSVQKPLQNILLLQNKNTQTVKLIAIEPYDAASIKRTLQRKYNTHPLAKDLEPSPLDQSCLETGPGGIHCRNSYFSYDERFRSWQEDAYFNSYLGSYNDNLRLWMGDLSLNSLYESTDQIPKDVLKSDAVLRLVVQAKFFDGYVNYNQQEQKVLKEWLKSKIYSEKIPKRYLNDIVTQFRTRFIAFNEASKRDYLKSTLKQLFDQLQKELG